MLIKICMLLSRPDKRVQRLVEKLGKEEKLGQIRVLALNKVDAIEQKRSLLPLAKQFEDLLGFDRFVGL
jgi:GTP-binding protein Era